MSEFFFRSWIMISSLGERGEGSSKQSSVSFEETSANFNNLVLMREITQFNNQSPKEHDAAEFFQIDWSSLRIGESSQNVGDFMSVGKAAHDHTWPRLTNDPTPQLIFKRTRSKWISPGGTCPWAENYSCRSRIQKHFENTRKIISP